MPRLTHLTMSFEPVAAHAALPLLSLTMLEVLAIHGVDSCPSLSSLSRLTRLVLVSHPLPVGPSRPPVYRASADLSQVLKVCYIFNVAAIHKRLWPCQTLSHMLPGSSSITSSGPELGLP